MAINTMVRFKRAKYFEWIKVNPIIEKDEVIAVLDLPWYKSWFGLKPVRLKYGVGKSFKKTKFI